MKNGIVYIIIFLVILALLFVLFGGMEYFGGDSEKVCPECGQVYGRGDVNGNYRSITLRGMCKSCYMEYKAANGQ